MRCTSGCAWTTTRLIMIAAPNSTAVRARFQPVLSGTASAYAIGMTIATRTTP